MILLLSQPIYYLFSYHSTFLTKTIATGGFGNEFVDFDSTFLFPRLGNNSESDLVTFLADPKGGGFSVETALVTFAGEGFNGRNYNEINLSNDIAKPAIADDGTVVIKDLGERIVLYDYQLNLTDVIASNFKGFSSVGESPGISDEGGAIVFYGNLTNPGADSTTQGLDSGEGIFVSIKTDAGRKIERIAGIAGNGILDPGETHEDTNENGQVDLGEDQGLIGSFSTDERDRFGINFNENTSSGNIVFLANDELGQESIIDSNFKISTDEEATSTTVTSKLVAKAGQEASEIQPDLTGNIQDLHIYDPINKSGQIAFWAETTTSEEAVIRANPIRKPVFILPGIGGSFPENADFPEWLLNKGGIEPDELRIEPFSDTYSDLIETLERAGYREGIDLFVANYDWRLNPAPIDGTIDGEIDHSIEQLTDDYHEYAVDQLAFWLEEAVEGWKSQFSDLPEAEIPELDSVDVIAHSTGGLVARSYIQSTGYGENFTNGNGEQVKLPEIDNLMMVGVPNRGASLAYSPLNNDFSTGRGAALLGFLSRAALNKVRIGNTITVDGNAESPFAIQPQEPGTIIDPIEFIADYVPTIQSLLATYPFIQPLPNNNQAVNPLQRAEEFDADKTNTLLLDLNNGYDSLARGENVDPNVFADEQIGLVTVIHGVNEVEEVTEDGEIIGTRDAVVERDEPEMAPVNDLISIDVPQRTVLPIERVGASSVVLPTLNAEVPDGVWYRNITGHYADRENPDWQGDETVPLISSIGQFNNDNFEKENIVLEPFIQGEGGNTTESVGHNALMYNVDVQKLILETLGADLDEDLISANLNGPNLLELGGSLTTVNLSNFILDPVEGFIVDGQGRRLGYTNATGAITEIPGSFWLGETDGIGFINSLVEGPFQLELTGLGEDYFVSVALETENGPAGIEAEGFLADGEQLTLDVPLLPEPPLVTEPRINGGKDDVYTDSLDKQWSGNNGLSGGRSYANTNAIAKTDDDLLYQSEYLGNNFFYSQDVINGSYDVTLHFAETVFFRAGQRVFDVSAENQLVLDNFDIIDEAGGQNIATERTFTVGVNDGTLDLDFLAEVNNAKISAIEIKPDNTIARVNAGFDNIYTDSLGLEWSANMGLSGGRSSSRDNAIAQTDNDPLYQSEYYGQDFDYSQSVANGSYDVTLHFAETVFFREGQRVFDVSAENQLVLDDFDIIDEAGGQNIAVEKTFTVGVSDGTLDLDFLAEVNNAKISAIEIEPSII